MSMILSKDLFKGITTEDQVLHADGTWHDVKEIKDGVLTTKEGKEMHRIGLKNPFFRKKPKAVQPTRVSAPKPQPKSPETLRLEALMEKFPDKKDFILDSALETKLSVDQIEAELIMIEASENAKGSKKNNNTTWL